MQHIASSLFQFMCEQNDFQCHLIFNIIIPIHIKSSQHVLHLFFKTWCFFVNIMLLIQCILHILHFFSFFKQKCLYSY